MEAENESETEDGRVMFLPEMRYNFSPSPLSRRTHVGQETRCEISRYQAAPTLHRTVPAAENSLWEIRDSGEKDVMGQQGMKTF